MGIAVACSDISDLLPLALPTSQAPDRHLLLLLRRVCRRDPHRRRLLLLPLIIFSGRSLSTTTASASSELPISAAKLPVAFGLSPHRHRQSRTSAKFFVEDVKISPTGGSFSYLRVELDDFLAFITADNTICPDQNWEITLLSEPADDAGILLATNNEPPSTVFESSSIFEGLSESTPRVMESDAAPAPNLLSHPTLLGTIFTTLAKCLSKFPNQPSSLSMPLMITPYTIDNTGSSLRDAAGVSLTTCSQNSPPVSDPAPGIQSLDLSRNALNGLLPSALKSLRSLVTLNLSLNAFLKAIQAGFGDMTSLKFLDQMVSWNIMLAGYDGRGHGDLADGLFDQMVESGVRQMKLYLFPSCAFAVVPTLLTRCSTEFHLSTPIHNKQALAF